MDPSTSAFLSTLIINSIFFVLFLILFSIFQPFNRSLYFPKTVTENPILAPKIPRRYLFGWIFDVWELKHDDFIQYSGPDGLIFLYFIKQNFYIFLIVTIFGVSVLLPLNVTDSNIVGGLNKTTISNVARGSLRLWAHSVFTFFFS
ncbi:hypothetical protein BB561_004868, partial [Smittium simulii]